MTDSSAPVTPALRVIPQVAYRGKAVSIGDELPPVRLVRELALRGAKEIALLDIDGAPANDPTPQWLSSIVAIAGVPVRYDGRLHDAKILERLTGIGFAGMVVDYHALDELLLARWALDLYGEKLIVELQTDGEYLFEVPGQDLHVEVIDAVMKLHGAGVRRVLVRDIISEQPDIEYLSELIRRSPGVQFTYQGAVRTKETIAQLAELAPRLEAVLVDASRVLSSELSV